LPRSKLSKTIALRVDLSDKLMKKYKTELKEKPNRTNREFGGYVNDILSQVLDKDHFLHVFAPRLSVIEMVDNVLYLSEISNNKKKTIEVYLKNGKLYCSACDKMNCNHIIYAFAIPEISKMNLEDIKPLSD